MCRANEIVTIAAPLVAARRSQWQTISAGDRRVIGPGVSCASVGSIKQQKAALTSKRGKKNALGFPKRNS
jgi:hypothetical protein